MAQLVTIKSSTSRITLRSPKVSDAPTLLARCQSPGCVQYQPHLRDMNPPATVEFLEKLIRNWREESMKDSLFLVVQRESDGEVIGDGGFESLDLPNKKAEAGIMLNDTPDVRGQGYAVEAMATTFDYGFKTLGLDSIRMGTDKDNVPMKTLLEKKFGLALDSEGSSWYTLTKENWLGRSQ